MGKFNDIIKKNIIDTYLEAKNELTTYDTDINSTDIDKSIKAEASKVVLENKVNNVYYERLINVFQAICQNLNDDEFSKLQTKFIEKDEKKFNEFRKFITERSPKYKNRDYNTLPLKEIYNEFRSAFFKDSIVDYLNLTVESVGEVKCDELVDSILKNDPVENRFSHDFDKIVNEAKKSLEVSGLTKAEKEELSTILDEANELEYVSKAQDDSIEKTCSSLVNKRARLHVKEYVKEHKLENYIEASDTKVVYKDNAFANPKAQEEIKPHEMTFSDGYKQKIINVYHKMDSLGLLDSEFITEQGTKIYGFRHFYDARLHLKEVITNKDFSSLKKAKEDYLKEYNNLKEIYSYIKENINPDYLSFPGNMSNLRQSYVPREFSEDLPVNATLNGFYYVFSSLKASNIKIEDFAENPILGSKNIVEKLYSQDQTDLVFNNVSREEKILRLHAASKNATVRSTFRFVENFVCHEPKFNAQNALNNMLFVSNDDANTATSFEYGDFYFLNNQVKTLTNLIVTNKDNIAFTELYGENTKTRDAMHIHPAFDIKGYVEKNGLDVESSIEYAKSLLKEITKLKENGLYKLNGQKSDKPFTKQDYEVLVGPYYKDITLALFNLANLKELTLPEVNQILDFSTNIKEVMAESGLAQDDLDLLAKNKVLSSSIKKFRETSVFYQKLDSFNQKYGLDLDSKVFEEATKEINFNSKQFFKDEFIKLFDNVYFNDNGKTFKDGTPLTDIKALKDFSKEFNELASIAINDYTKEDNKSPLEEMNSKEKIEMFERCFGVNRIENVTYNNESFRSLNQKGYKNLSYTDKCYIFDSAKSKIDKALEKFDQNIDSNNKKAFLQSYREVYQAMNRLHNKNWFVNFIIHNKAYRQEKKALSDTITLVSSKLNLEKEVIEMYFAKKDDTLYSKTMKDLKENKDSVKSHSFDEALEISNTITNTVKEIDKDFGIESSEVDILTRTEKEPKNLDGYRRSIEAVDLDNNIDIKVDNVEESNSKELNQKL